MVLEFREPIYQSGFEKQFDVTIELTGVTIAKEDLVMKEDKIFCCGEQIQHILNPTMKRGFIISPIRSLIKNHYKMQTFGSILSTVHPEVIERTKTYLKDKIRLEKSGIKKELQEWHRLLESMSFQRLKKFMQSDSERSTRMRQSLPFWPLLTEAKRKEFKSMAD